MFFSSLVPNVIDAFSLPLHATGSPTRRLTSSGFTSGSFLGNLAFDSRGDLYTLRVTHVPPDNLINTVYEFAPGASTNAVPLRSISFSTGSNSFSVQGIAADDSGRVFVSVAPGEFGRYGPSSIWIFAAGATGMATPSATYASSASTTTAVIFSVAAAPNGTWAVGSGDTQHTYIEFFPVPTTGAQTPNHVTTISTFPTATSQALFAPQIALSNTDAYTILDAIATTGVDLPSRIDHFRIGSDVPVGTITGPHTTLNGISTINIAAAPDGTVYVGSNQACFHGSGILGFSPGASGDVGPFVRFSSPDFAGSTIAIGPLGP